VSELVLRGIFMLRKAEIDWFYQQGASAIFPDRWEDYVAAIPRRERGDLVAAFYRRLTSRSRATRVRAARAWSVWEAATSFLHTNDENVDKWGEEDFAVAVARIECHYFVNKGFLASEDQLLRDVRRIRHVPAVIVQGRYDVVCPMMTAWDLHRAWPRPTSAWCPTPDTRRSSRASRTSWSARRTALRGRRRLEPPQHLAGEVARHRVAQDLLLAVLREHQALVESEVARELDALDGQHHAAAALDRVVHRVVDLVLLRVLRAETDSTRRPVRSACTRITASASPADGARSAPARSRPRPSSTTKGDSCSDAAT